MLKYVQKVRDELVGDKVIYQKTNSVAETLNQNDISYPFMDSVDNSVFLDSITATNGQMLWKEMNKIAKKLSSKLNNKVQTEGSRFVLHNGFKITGFGRGESHKYIPFTLTMDDGQTLTALAKNVKNLRSFNPKQPLEITHWFINKKDATRAIYKNGDTTIDEATTIARLKALIEMTHAKFVANNPDIATGSAIQDLKEEINAMTIDLNDVVYEPDKSYGEKIQDMEARKNTESKTEENKEATKEKGIKYDYVVTLPEGTKKYINTIRESFLQDDVLKTLSIDLQVGQVSEDAIARRNVVIEGESASIKTKIKQYIEFSTIGYDKIEGKEGARMPAVALIRNAEFVKSKTGVDYTIEHHQNATFLTDREEFVIQEDGRGYNLLRAKGKYETWSVKERWLISDMTRKRVIETINEALEKEANKQELGAAVQEPKDNSEQLEKLKVIKGFIGGSQYSILEDAVNSEDNEFEEVINRLHQTITTMPKTYEQDGKGDKAVAYLHYFNSDSDWYITEKDMEDEQLQAFGLVSLHGGEPELGYISIEELKSLNIELDFHWDNKTIGEIKGHDVKERLREEEASVQTPSFDIKATTSEEFEQKLDELAEQLEKEGIIYQYEEELNKLADQLTELMKAENE
ncbi:MAG: DUF2958 domain-containing protein [Sulfurimonas sp.]